MFGLADRATESVMRAILPQIRGSEIERARRRRPEDLAAYGLTMRAFPFVFASNPAAAKQALEFLNRAIEIEPDYAPSTALAAWCHAQLVLYNGTPSPGQERKNALLLSERAGILDPDDPLVLTARCAVHTMAGQLGHAGALISRSLQLDPTLVWSWERSGWLKAYSGNGETAVRHFEQATRLDPRRPNANRLTIATHLLDTGADLRFLQDWLGHANIQTPSSSLSLSMIRRDQVARGCQRSA